MPPSVPRPRSPSPHHVPRSNKKKSLPTEPSLTAAGPNSGKRKTLKQHRQPASSTRLAKTSKGYSSSATTSVHNESHQAEIPTTTTSTTNSSSTTTTALPQENTVANKNFLAQQNTAAAFGGNGMYGGAGGYGMMMGSPYMSSFGYGGGMMPGGMPGQPFSGLNQFLFGVQSVIFSLGQAVQIMGMNTQAVHQLLDTATTMFDHALGTWKEMRALEANVNAAVEQSEEDKKKLRRLKVLRWAMTLGVAYAAYRIIRRLLFQKRRQRNQNNLLTAGGYQSSMLPQYYDNNPYGNQYDAAQTSYSPLHGNSSALMSSPNHYGNNLYGGAGQYPTNNNLMYGPQQYNQNGMGYY